MAASEGDEPGFEIPGFEIQVQVVEDDIGLLRWSDQTDLETLQEAVSLAADDALIGHGLRRVEAQVLSRDVIARRALQRAGFRREGVRREALRVGDQWHDVVVYGRLAADQVYGPGGFSGVMNSVLPTKRLIAHVVFTDTDGRVLLLETTYKSDHELPGGVVEPLESPRDGAVREVTEEIGLLVQLGDPALVDWMPPYLGWADAVEFIYDGGALDERVIATMRLDAGEIVAAHWYTPDEMADHVSELSARRIRATLDARTAPLPGPATIFTQNGYRQGS